MRMYNTCCCLNLNTDRRIYGKQNHVLFPQVSRLNEDRRHKTWTCCSSLLREHVSYSLKVNMCIWGDIVGTPFKKRQEQTAETAFLKHLAAFGVSKCLVQGGHAKAEVKTKR